MTNEQQCPGTRQLYDGSVVDCAGAVLPGLDLCWWCWAELNVVGPSLPAPDVPGVDAFFRIDDVEVGPSGDVTGWPARRASDYIGPSETAPGAEVVRDVVLVGSSGEVHNVAPLDLSWLAPDEPTLDESLRAYAARRDAEREGK